MHESVQVVRAILAPCLAVCLWVAGLGCGGVAFLSPTDASADSTSADAALGEENLKGPSVDASPSDGGLDALDAWTSSWPEASDAGAADAAPAVEVRAPDALPDGACGGPARPDSGASPCAYTTADVTCASGADCVAQPIISCGCYDLVLGVNRHSHGPCPPPPCPPPIDGCDGGGLVTAYCETVASVSQVSVACVDHQCVAFATVGAE